MSEDDEIHMLFWIMIYNCMNVFGFFVTYFLVQNNLLHSLLLNRIHCN